MRAVAGNSSILATVNNYYTKEKSSHFATTTPATRGASPDWITPVFRHQFGIIIMVYPLPITDATSLNNSITCNHVIRLTKTVIPTSECTLLLFAAHLALALSGLLYTAMLTKV